MRGLWLFLLVTPALAQESKTVTFPSQDGLEITADLYMAHPETAPLIVLFHQARWSRGEYVEIAPKLNLLGFNCLAVDLRSGGEVNGIRNLTKLAAERALKPTRYIDAYQDLVAAVNYARQYLARGKLIVWGSSYSSALVLRFAGEHPQAVDAVLSFSPGEYFRNQGKPATWITEGAAGITVPVFITSAKGEKSSWWKIYEAIPAEGKTWYLPETAGNHGSRALWSKFPDSMQYWAAVEKFLQSIK